MTTGEAHTRYARWWDVYFGIVAVAIATAILLSDGHPRWRRLVAVGAIAAMMALQGLAGRRMARTGTVGHAALAVVIGQIVLFATAVVAVPFATWLLFAVIPLIFQLVEMGPAIVLVIVVNLVTPVVDLVRNPSAVLADLIVAIISAATGVWLGFWIIRVIEQNVERGQLIAELEDSRAENARLSHEAGVAAERARLAGEIHDTLAQGFTSIITLLQAADPELRDERLALAVRTAKENLAESRALLAALAPAALSEGSLLDSVRRQATRFTEETGISATVRVTGEERALPTAVEVVLLRAAQEALTNVRRHAAAREVAVLLAYAPSSVRLVVRDDGRGFDPAAAVGFGLNGMRARADQVHGTLSVHSDPDSGTTIELEVPA
ncbi:signal transduction histidine kinase [Actinoplanes tereljensis]|uniref:Two-component sensor histidine kinase n=1 Tax=Paractinoplanes tereljensis TaxID=571912 RepID=A0A919TPI6_9ACTN|nr:sensor histidine kinase [Actinoplanes tereljensis]GIF18018.1 two-component sensor histidine kinase [Actinoplanes tereljensis]